jgi:hypothetical protein
MSVRTTEDLIDAFAIELAWRRRELTELKRLVESSSENLVSQAALTRCAVALLYAHWEGIVKRLTETYIEFVSMQRLKNSELSDCMLAIIVRSKFHDAGVAQKLSSHLAVLNFFRTGMGERSRIPYKKVVQTESNLSSKVFSEILTTVGIPTTAYEPKFNILDHQLLARRNHIAHGQMLDIDESEYLELQSEVSDLFTLYRNDLENAAVTKLFRRGAHI